MSNGSSPPSLATHTALRERKYTAFTRPPLTGKVELQGGEKPCARVRVREGRVNEGSKGMESLLVLLLNFHFEEYVLCAECHTRLVKVPQGKSSTTE